MLRPILVVEDNQIDFEMIERAFSQGKVANKIYRVEDGEEALAFLYGEEPYTGDQAAPRPFLILLDLNLPGLDGKDVLEEIKQDPDLKSIPVIVLTTSSDPKDIEKCYSMGANSFITKPVTLDGFINAINQLNDYWFGIVTLDNRE